MPDQTPDTSSFNPLDYPIAFEDPRCVDGIGWQEHIPFAMALVDIAEPQKIVELGVHSGDSYLALCQAVQRLELDTQCWGVDTWKGDAHAGFYGDQVLSALAIKHGQYTAFSTLKQMTFDEAAAETTDGSVDLLHIDGFHAYEAVKHDFETWLPKMSARGIVLFHDTCEKARDFGVYRFWEEVENTYPSLSFHHGHGIGVLFVGPSLSDKVGELVAAGRDPEKAAGIRGLYAALGERITLRMQLQRRSAPQSAQPQAARIPEAVQREWAALHSRVQSLDALMRLKP